MKTRKLRKKNLKKSKSRRKKYGGQPKIQPRLLMRDTPESATVFILLFEEEIRLTEDISFDYGDEYENEMMQHRIYDISERMHNLPEFNNEAPQIQLNEYWNGISREVGLRLFIFYGTKNVFYYDERFTNKIAEIAASEVKPVVCILLGCSTSNIAYELNRAHNIANRCYFIGINETYYHHKYNKTSVLCRDESLLNEPITKLEDIYGTREKIMKEFTTRRCKMLKRDNIVNFLMEIKPRTNGPQRTAAGKVIKNTGILGRDTSYFPTSRLDNINDVSDFKKEDYERKYKEWLDKMLIRHIEYDNGDIYDGYAYLAEEWIKTETGTMRYANGDEYTGNWYDDKREGRGKMTYSDGTIYEGDWENDEPKR